MQNLKKWAVFGSAIALTACVEHGDCDFEAGCTMKPHWPIINSKLRGALAEISLEQLRASPTPNFVTEHAA